MVSGRGQKVIMAKYKVRKKDCSLIIIAKLALKEKVDKKQIEIFSNKNIRGFLKIDSLKKYRIEYSGPIAVSLYERLQKPIDKYDFFLIMEQIVDIVQKSNFNGISVGNIVFDIKKIFINEKTKVLHYIYLPLEQKISGETDIINLMESIIYSANPSQEQDDDYISEFAFFINSFEKLDIDKIEKYIDKIDCKIINTIKRHNTGQSGFITDNRAEYMEHYEQRDPEATGMLGDSEATGLLNEDTATGILEDSEATGLLNEEEATGLLDEENQTANYPGMYRFLTDETIYINKPVFRIGKERSYSDYFISNNDKISRSHADIITRGQRYYIRDLNSKNKTFVNGTVIPADQEVEIFHENIIKLANEEFEFRVQS